MRCENCKLDKPDVRERVCGYTSELYGTEKLETICDECEWEHLRDI